MKLRNHILTLLLCKAIFLSGLSAQPNSFSVELEEIVIPGMPGLQSFAFGQSSGKWLFIGGRTEGLHERQPFAFTAANNNEIMYVVDPVNAQVWSSSLNQLPAPIHEQLQSTNMNFVQHEDTLYIIGGYSYSTSVANHITFPSLTILNVSSVIQSIITGSNPSSYFQQITDQRMAVTGGALGYLDGMFYLAGGQRFDGRYNQNNGPSFVQSYSNEIRMFQLQDSSGIQVIRNYHVLRDTAELHRRDYNMLPQVFPNGNKGFTMFSGVFQYGQNIPWLNTVDIHGGNYYVRPAFNQYLNQYHSAKLALWDSLSGNMYSIFFGGMSRYTLDTLTNTLIDDIEVPFVKTISMVTRFSNDTMTETRLPVDMPALLGSGAEFIPDETYGKFVLNYHDLPSGRTHIGTIAGGIESSAPNIFFFNTGIESIASSRLFKVYINKSTTTGIDGIIVPKTGFKIKIAGENARSRATLYLTSHTSGKAYVELRDVSGRHLRNIHESMVLPGLTKIPVPTDQLSKGIYIVSVRIGAETKSVRIIVSGN